MTQAAIVELFFHPFQLNSQKVLLALHENRISYKPIEVNIFKGETFRKEFLAINPNGEVPVVRYEKGVYVTIEEILLLILDLAEKLDQTNDNGSIQEKTAKDKELQFQSEETDKYISSLVTKLDHDALILGCLQYFDELGFVPDHPYNSVIFRENMKSMMLAQVSRASSKIKAFPDYAGYMLNRRVRSQHSIKTASSKKLFNTLLFEVITIFDVCENLLKSKENEESWLISSEKMSTADIHFGLLLHHLHELGMEATVHWRNHPYIDGYYRRFVSTKSFKEIERLSFNDDKGIPRWKTYAVGILFFAVLYGVTKLLKPSAPTKLK